MAQENANILHAAIRIKAITGDDPATDPPQIIAETGIEVASVKLRQDLAAIGVNVYEVDLVTGIDDSELVCSWISGVAVGPDPVGDPPVPTATLNTLPDNIMRPTEASQANTDKRRFWIASTVLHELHVEWWRIPPLVEPIPTGFVPAPGGQ
jgi:hypothetical protein